jgi:plasmid stability protein
MRTTISLSDGLAADIKRRAAEQGVSVSALIESLLRDALHAKPRPRTVPRFRLVTVAGRGVVEGVDLDRAARIVEAEDAESLVKAGR